LAIVVRIRSREPTSRVTSAGINGGATRRRTALSLSRADCTIAWAAAVMKAGFLATLITAAKSFFTEMAAASALVATEPAVSMEADGCLLAPAWTNGSVKRAMPPSVVDSEIRARAVRATCIAPKVGWTSTPGPGVSRAAMRRSRAAM